MMTSMLDLMLSKRKKKYLRRLIIILELKKNISYDVRDFTMNILG